MPCKSALFFLVLLQALVNSFTGWYSLKQRSATIYFPNPRSSQISSRDGAAIMMSTRQSQSTNGNQLRKKVSQPLITSLSSSRIKIGGQRWILPGDYIVHEDYGVGRFSAQICNNFRFPLKSLGDFVLSSTVICFCFNFLEIQWTTSL
jgi:hypothetical protein